VWWSLGLHLEKKVEVGMRKEDRERWGKKVDYLAFQVLNSTWNEQLCSYGQFNKLGPMTSKEHPVTRKHSRPPKFYEKVWEYNLPHGIYFACIVHRSIAKICVLESVFWDLIWFPVAHPPSWLGRGHPYPLSICSLSQPSAPRMNRSTFGWKLRPWWCAYRVRQWKTIP